MDTLHKDYTLTLNTADIILILSSLHDRAQARRGEGDEQAAVIVESFMKKLKARTWEASK